MSSNREIPQRVIVATQNASNVITIAARGEEYFDSVVSKDSPSDAANSISFYGGGIHSYYAEGGTTCDNLISFVHLGVLIDDQSVVDECELVTDPSAAVTNGETVDANIEVFRDGVEITDDLTDVPNFDNIDISVADSVYSLDNIDVDGPNTEDELKVGDLIKITTASSGLIHLTLTERNLKLKAGYYEAKESHATVIKAPAGVPVYGRFTKISIPASDELGDVVITKG